MRRSHPFATAGFLLVLHGCGAVQPAAEAKQPAAAAVWPAGPWPCMLAQAVVVRNEEAGCMAAGVLPTQSTFSCDSRYVILCFLIPSCCGEPATSTGNAASGASLASLSSAASAGESCIFG